MVKPLGPLLFLLLGACGYPGSVSRIDMNRTDIPKSELQARQKAETERVQKQLTPPSQTRPQRVDEILTKSAPREDDPFNLPPE